MPNDLQLILKEKDIDAPQELQNAFSGLFNQAKEWEGKAKAIVVTSADQTDEMQKAREARLILKEIRVEAEKVRKARKESVLREGKAIDGLYNVIEFLIVPLEDHLAEQEKFAENLIKKQMEELKEKRIAEASQFADLSFVKVEDMPEEIYQDFLKRAKESYEARIKAEKDAELAKIEADRLAKIEQERIQKENEELKKKAEAQEAALAAERKKTEEARLKAEAEANKKLEAERKEREKVEAELKAKEEDEKRKKAEAEAEAKRIEDEKKKSEREAALAPDKEKLDKLAVQIVQLSLPEVKSEEAKAVLKAVVELLNKTSNYIKEKSINL